MHRLAPPPSVHPSILCDAIDWAMVTRRSIRAFLPMPVPKADIESILQVASHSASGVNTQPWRVHVVTGAAKKKLSDAILTIFNDPVAFGQLEEPYAYYPRQWMSPYLERRRKIGWDLYGLLEIPKTDKARMHAQHARNYSFFDAPAGLFFTIDRVMESGSLIDYGMFLQSIMGASTGPGHLPASGLYGVSWHHRCRARNSGD